MHSERVRILDEVADALERGTPLVALETAVMTAGLPRRCLATLGITLTGWPDDVPVNLLACRRMSEAVRTAGAIPAVTAVVNGGLRIGLDDTELADLAADEAAGKAGTSTMATALATGASAGTTVSGTLVACSLSPQPIRVFATGGIGGVHRNWTEHPDISADLGELARRRCAVVCSGAKSLLDIPATLELLEAAGVPVLGYRTDVMPAFITAGHHRLGCRHDDVDSIAATARARWGDLDQAGSLLVVNPAPDEVLVSPDEADEALQAALSQAAETGVTGPAVTPFVLEAMAGATAGRTLRANLVLLERNAALAGDLAMAMRR
jgi:pseudouridine-5'-phosphate glycosidase